ncbi:MAG: hydroxymethylglutaryl-CoA reductase, degradative [Candidatus Thermoplasmatota archaeon]|nr:hydroxymethylglutaryl-CoA reductase, degradative [Candidatus Thermoplasmatota archaeon]
MSATSQISGFYKLPIGERIKILRDFAELTDDETALLSKEGSLPLATADTMIENVIGTHALPLGIATNFLINGKELLIPMCTEEPSVIAAASNAAKMARPSGFSAKADKPLMIGQIQIIGKWTPKAISAAKSAVAKNKKKILALANSTDAKLIELDGGAKDVEFRTISTAVGKMVILHLIVDVRDAMGANAVNTMCEKVAPLVEEITGGKVRLRILSNLADKRRVRAKAIFNKDEIGGSDVVEGIIEAWAFADADPYRAATHNKGIMNGIDAAAIACGQDWRAIEAGTHAYAAHSGKYRSLTQWRKDKKGNLVGEIELPMAVGIVGGAVKAHPTARVCTKILGIKSAGELAEILASVGLAQNFAALRALATEGIQKGHMKLHKRKEETK